ncbi:ABC transporter [Bifidobacterium pseudolongum subsp. pseudolongum]|nr:ABC transporter substrate-binding protein [Bifidobacterium pseudolongum]PKU99382.1 ABC transporter [Bifidobacterium pseudolongum subsp. pseudolongum]PKV07251.1 ABC transporter [Bifidobacterium pseudolongum subsp. pseudolongum]RYQ47681.1 ABC transporter [Bifidobacterium pseudolongum subsp. pseudolongum]RYQ61752.1 ABC transporter [Bifidobacterium pseudolongum subsp. pseudolongum]
MLFHSRFSRQSTHATAAVASIAALGMLLAGCGAGGGTGSPSAQNSSGTATASVITVNNVEPSASLLPGNTNDMASWKVVTQLFEGLVTFSDDGKLIYADAKSITPNSDASQYTITLRDGLRFSDGQKITAQTYAKAWSFAANAANGQLGAAIFSTIQGYDALQDTNGGNDAQLSGLKVVDDHTLQVTLNAPDSSFPYKVGDVAFLPIPESAYADVNAFGEHPIGNGPYMLKQWDHDSSIQLVPNPKYTGLRTPKNGGVTFELYTDVQTAYADVESGNLDVIDTIPTSALATYQHENGIQAFNKPGPAFRSFTIPQKLKHFSGEEGRLRRAAISHAVNRANIIEKVMYGTATVATDFTAPTIAGYSKSLKGADVLDYNTETARKLWSQADAISPWSGTFRLAYSADSGDKQRVEGITNSIKNALGIDAQPYIIPTQKELSSAIHDRTINAAFLQGLQSDYPYPEGYLMQAYDSSAADGKGLNNGDYKSTAFDKLIDDAARQTNVDDAISYYHQAEEVLFKDLPVIPLWYANVTAAAGEHVQHVGFNYMGVPKYNEITK